MRFRLPIFNISRLPKKICCFWGRLPEFSERPTVGSCLPIRKYIKTNYNGNYSYQTYSTDVSLILVFPTVTLYLLSTLTYFIPFDSFLESVFHRDSPAGPDGELDLPHWPFARKLPQLPHICILHMHYRSSHCHRMPQYSYQKAQVWQVSLLKRCYPSFSVQNRMHFAEKGLITRRVKIVTSWSRRNGLRCSTRSFVAMHGVELRGDDLRHTLLLSKFRNLKQNLPNWWADLIANLILKSIARKFLTQHAKLPQTPTISMRASINWKLWELEKN